MIDLISRSAVISVLQELVDMETCGNSISDIGFGLLMAIGRLISAPAADAVPVEHARWIPDCETVGDDYFGYDEEWFVRCSRCGRIERDVDAYPLMDGDIRAVKQDYPYCHCGARMDGEENVVD